MASVEQRAYYSRRDPAVLELIRNGSFPEPMAKPDQDLDQARDAELKARTINTTRLAKYFDNEDFSNVLQQDTIIPFRGNETIPARLYHPQVPPRHGSPLIMMFHAGGFCLGGIENENLPCRLFVKHFGAVVFNVLYRMAPEFPFPTAVEDAWDALRWLAKNAAQLKATPSQGFIVAGTSAGGNLADVLGHLARDTKLNPPLTGLLENQPPVCPYPMMPERYKGYYTSHENAEDALLVPAGTIRWFHAHNKPDMKSELFVPFNWPTGHHGLPPIALQVCGDDILRDGQLIYEKILREELGTKTRLTVYPGMPHYFHAYLPELKQSRELIRDMVNSMGWLLGGEDAYT
ncbi:MAG: hypothetical protein Q9159_007435 [Coniocarpon cinnabarinum]